MTVELHPECRARLVQLIARALAPTRVAGHWFTDSDLYDRLRAANSALPTRGPLSDELHKYIGETPIITFVVEEVHHDLRQGLEYDAEANPRLVELPGFENPDETATRLIERLETLPWRYELMLPMPHAVSDLLQLGTDGPATPLSEHLSLVVFDAETAASLPGNEEPEGLGLLLGGPTTVIREGQLTVVEEIDGYVGRFATTRPVEDYQLKVRALLGVLLAQRVAVAGLRQAPRGEQTIRVYRRVDGTRTLSDDQSFSAEFTRAFRALNAETWDERFRRQAARQTVTLLKALFGDEEGNESVIRGSQWLFDSYSSGSNLLAFIQTSVAMEILAGGDRRTTDLIGVGNLVGNRCAYLIANSREERGEILRDFRAAYDIRSRIVHEGKSRLSASERAALARLRWMCYRVIQEELDLMAKG